MVPSRKQPPKLLLPTFKKPLERPLSGYHEVPLLTLIGHSPFAGNISLRINSVDTAPGFYDIPTKQLFFGLRQPYYVNKKNLYEEVCINTHNN